MTQKALGPKRLSRSDRNKRNRRILKDHEKGLTRKALSVKYDLHPNMVSRIVRPPQKGRVKQGRPTGVTPERMGRVHQIVQHLKRGYQTHAALGKLLGVSRQCIAQDIKLARKEGWME